MFRRLWRAAALVALVIVAPTLGSCDSESTQRQAFIEFLQTRIINRPGLHIPIMNQQNIKDFGSYADQYRIMSDFHHQIDASIAQDLSRAMQMGKPSSIQDLVSNRGILPLVITGMAKFKDETENAKTKADAAHAALNQPPDLKAVYDAAYERMVTTPATVFLEMGPMIRTSLASLQELASFIDLNSKAITYRDGVPVTDDVKVRVKLDALLRDAVEAAKTSDEGKRQLRVLVEGK